MSDVGKSIFDDAIKLYKDRAIFAALVDADLMVVWANDAALERFNSLNLPDGVLFMLPNNNTGMITETLKKGNVLSLHSNSAPLTSTAITMTPLLSEEGLVGAVVFFTMPDSAQSALLNPEGASRTIHTFNNQFRTPLTDIFAALSVTSRALENLEATGDYESVYEYINNINQNCYKMLRTVENISLYTKFSSAINEMNFKRTDFTLFMQNLCQALKVVIDPTDIVFNYELPSKKITMLFDVEMIENAFLNIISNSCRFTREGNVISVVMEASADSVMVTVTDRGKGIKGDIINRIFEPYFSCDPLGVPYAGAGLGLTNAKYAITAHGGTIAVSSSFGEGTTIAFKIPRKDSGGTCISMRGGSSEYILRKFSSVHKMLSDTCRTPTP